MREGGREEGGRNSLKSWGEVRVTADRQIAAERMKQIGGKINEVCVYVGKETRG